jgi:hypothetical protein
MAAVGRLIVAGARLVARLMPRRRRSAAEQARLARAVAGIDRELAGNLELVTMFMQTKQPAVLENAAMRAYRGEIAAADETTAGRLDALYDAMSEAESAMERRGPAGSIPRADRDTVERWEGEARSLQRELRSLPGRRPRSVGDRLVDWVRARVERSPAA